MKIAIQPDRTGDESYSDQWALALKKHGVDVKWVNIYKREILSQLRDCDGFMWRFIHLPDHKKVARRILRIVEDEMEIPVFPDQDTCWHYDDKIAQYYLFKAHGIPSPKTWIFWNKNDAIGWANKHARYPVVWKLACGASSSNVALIRSKEEAHRVIKRMFSTGWSGGRNSSLLWTGMPSESVLRRLIGIPWAIAREVKWQMKEGKVHLYDPRWKSYWEHEHGYAYFQEFVQNNDFDTRITVIGDRAFGYRRMNRPNDFRASGSGNFVVAPGYIDKRCIEMAFRVSQLGKFQSMAYDFIYRNNQPVICEISYTFVDWMVHSCPGHWDTNLNWIDGQMWPEHAQVEDFLAYLESVKNK